jgi:hypothetical protein
VSFNVLQHDADPPVVLSEGDTMLEVMLLLLHVIHSSTLQSADSDGCASVPVIALLMVLLHSECLVVVAALRCVVM